jgi:hypothetical protein
MSASLTGVTALNGQKRENGREIQKQDLALMVDRGVFAGLGS